MDPTATRRTGASGRKRRRETGGPSPRRGRRPCKGNEERRRRRGAARTDEEGGEPFGADEGEAERAGGEADAQDRGVEAHDPAARRGRGHRRDPGLAQDVEGVDGKAQGEAGREPEPDVRPQPHDEEEEADAECRRQRRAVGVETVREAGAGERRRDHAERPRPGVEADQVGGVALAFQDDGHERQADAQRHAEDAEQQDDGGELPQ